jgi:hypothetical protein
MQLNMQLNMQLTHALRERTWNAAMRSIILLGAVVAANVVATVVAPCGNCTATKDVNIGDGHIRELPNSSAPACCAACGGLASCRVWAFCYSAASRAGALPGTCYLKDNMRPLPTPHEPGIISGVCAHSPPAPAPRAVVQVTVNWSQIVAVTPTAATVEVDVMPFISRTDWGGPFQSYYTLLSGLGAEFVRFAPWFPDPRAVIPELRPPDCNTSHPATNWNSTVLDGVISDFMRAVCGANATAGACKLSVAQQLSTMPSWLYVGGYCPSGNTSCLPSNPWETRDPYNSYNQGHKLHDPSCQQMARYVARVVGWYTAGGFMDECDHWHPSDLHYQWQLLSILNEDEHFVTPDDGTAYATCYDAIVAAVATINPDITPVGPEIAQPGIHSHDDVWRLNMIKHFLDPNNHANKIAPPVASYHWLVNFDNGSLTRPFLSWDRALAGAVDELERAKANTTEMVLNEYIPYVLDWCSDHGASTSGVSFNGGGTCPDWQSPKTAGGDPNLAHAKGIGINRNTWSWNAAAASFAYIFGTLAELGYKYVGIDQLVSGTWPDNQPEVAMIDWQTGQPNAKYFVARLLATTVGVRANKTIFVSTASWTRKGKRSDRVESIYSLAYQVDGGARGVLLVNKESTAVDVHLRGFEDAGLVSVVEVDVGAAEPGFQLMKERRVGQDGEISLGPLAVAIVS